jgi:hypothetical protein
MTMGANLATSAARGLSTTRIGSVGSTELFSMTSERIGSKCGCSRTWSSDNMRYLPGAMSNSQARCGSSPCIHGIRSDKCLGSVRRFEESRAIWVAISGVSKTIPYPSLPCPTYNVTVKSFVLDEKLTRDLTFTHIYRKVSPTYRRFESLCARDSSSIATHYWRRTKSEI